MKAHEGTNFQHSNPFLYQNINNFPKLPFDKFVPNMQWWNNTMRTLSSYWTPIKIRFQLDFDIIILWYDCTCPFKWNQAHWRRWRYDHNTPLWHHEDSPCCVLYRSVIHTSPRTYDPCHERQKHHGLYSTVLDYVSVSAEGNITHVEFVWEHSSVYNWKDHGCTRYDKIYLAWKTLEKSWMYQVR
jgi:hypothetical protein